MPLKITYTTLIFHLIMYVSNLSMSIDLLVNVLKGLLKSDNVSKGNETLIIIIKFYLVPLNWSLKDLQVLSLDSSFELVFAWREFISKHFWIICHSSKWATKWYDSKHMTCFARSDPNKKLFTKNEKIKRTNFYSLVKIQNSEVRCLNETYPLGKFIVYIWLYTYVDWILLYSIFYSKCLWQDSRKTTLYNIRRESAGITSSTKVCKKILQDLNYH